MNFKRICSIMAAKNCYEAGIPVKDIAVPANRSPSTIRRWLRIAGARRPK